MTNDSRSRPLSVTNPPATFVPPTSTPMINGPMTCLPFRKTSFIFCPAPHGQTRYVDKTQSGNQHGCPHAKMIPHPAFEGRNQRPSQDSRAQHPGNSAVVLRKTVDRTAENQREQYRTKKAAGGKSYGGHGL